MGVTVRRRATGPARAQAMGARAGADLRALGIPTRCPFRRPELVRAWARGYLAAAGPHR